MTTVLFWNLNTRPLENIVANLAFQHQVDVLILAECAIPKPTLLKKLNPHGAAHYFFAPSVGCTKVELYCKFPDQFLRPVLETDRLTIRLLKLPGLFEVLIAAVHMQSKYSWSGDSQSFECLNLAYSIKKAEEHVQHTRTILVGDLNMNPFETGMVSANGLHAIMSRETALRKTRTVAGVEYPFFYNPMWSRLGDARGTPPGTYYYEKAEHVVYFWNMFDQVLMRPDVLPLFPVESLNILSTDGNVSFLTERGHPDDSVASDHLPIVFKLNL